MGITQSLNELAGKYGMCSSWAVWNPEKPTDPQIIADHLNCLKSSVVMVGLNVSLHDRIKDPWQNFHGTDLARRLRYAFDASPYRGAYMTDIIKNEVEAKAGDLMNRVRNGIVNIQHHINSFCTEMTDVGANQHSLFILFGDDVHELFTKHLASTYPNFVKCRHYSHRWTSDAEWVENTWSTLEGHCQMTQSTFNTLQFARNETMERQLQELKDKHNQGK